jgi:hypothetical protein
MSSGPAQSPTGTRGNERTQCEPLSCATRPSPTGPTRTSDSSKRSFAELAERQPDNFRYATFRLEDGVTFVHVVVETDDGSNPIPLPEIAAFREFQREIGERCAVQPAPSGATIVGSHRFFPT